MLYQSVYRPAFLLGSVARLFAVGKRVCKEDFMRRINMGGMPTGIRQLFSQLEFDDVVVDGTGMIILDAPGGGAYSDC